MAAWCLRTWKAPIGLFAVFILGYVAVFVGWYWWALRSDDPISAVVFVVPLFLVELLIVLASVLTMSLMEPPRRLRVWLNAVFLLSIGLEVSAFGHADVNSLGDAVNGRLGGLLGYGSRMCLLTIAFCFGAARLTGPRR